MMMYQSQALVNGSGGGDEGAGHDRGNGCGLVGAS